MAVEVDVSNLKHLSHLPNETMENQKQLLHKSLFAEIPLGTLKHKRMLTTTLLHTVHRTCKAHTLT
jgi:hypothetical protein